TSRGSVSGKVATAKNEPAAYVSIGLEGTNYGTVTNDQGKFSFKAPAGSYTLVISYIGVDRIEIPVTIAAGQTFEVPQITVNASLSQLNEVNVIATRSNRFTSRVSNDVSKIPLTPLENAQSYTTITGELMKEQQIFSVDDALRNAPGVQKLWDATTRAGDGGGIFTQRGFETQARLRNGIAGLVTNTIDAVNIEKVEVIKGPSATLYGSTLTSFGGLINRVTKKPYETFGLEIGHTVGSYDLSRTSIDLNTPLTADNNVLFRLNSAYNYEGSFRNYGNNRTFAVAPSLFVRANDKLTFLFEAELYYGRAAAKPFFFFYASPLAMGVNEVKDLNIDYKQAYVNDDITMFSRNINYFAQANYKISDKFTSQTVFSSSNSFSNGSNPFYYLTDDATAQFLNPTLPASASGHDYIVRGDQTTRNSKFDAIEIQQNFNGDFKTGSIRHRAVLGLDFLRINSNQVFLSGMYDVVLSNDKNFDYGGLNKKLVDAFYAANPASVNTAFTYYYKKNTYSAYFMDVINLTDRLIASAGVRVDHYENKGTENYDRVQQTKPFSQTAVSPKFGLVFQPIKDQLSLFGNFQNGFINPDVYLNTTGESVVPEIQNANQLEGGVKTALFDGKLNATVSYYRISLTNVMRSVPNSPIFAQEQDGTQISKGFEAEVIATPFAGFNIIAGFAYNDSKLTGTKDSSLAGRRPITAGSPYLANLYLSYRLSQTALKGIGVGVGGNYGSNSYIVNSVKEGKFELPEYYVFNANVFFDRPKYHFGLTANNLNNRHYYTGYTTINPQKLRQFILSASYKF
ncbi:MAG: TonB-dependent receptor, partial [Sphingobacteriaceae bacterium]